VTVKFKTAEGHHIESRFWP